MYRSQRKSLGRPKEIVLPDLQEEDAFNPHDRKLQKSIRKPLGRSTGSIGQSPTKTQKTARELKREKLVREIRSFDEKQIAASLPDPEEEKRKQREIAHEQKLRKAVRDILDDMMQTIVVEVSLKLGGAMHAQQNAIKNIVDQYMSNNPVVNDRVDALKDALEKQIQGKIRELLPDVISKLQTELQASIEAGISIKLARNEENTNQKLENFQSEINSNVTLYERLQNDIQQLQNGLNSNETETAISALKDICTSHAESYCNDSVQSLKQQLEQIQTQYDKLKESHEDLKITTTEEQKTLEAKLKQHEMIQQKTIEKIGKQKGGCVIQ